jgi:hypothetical protein
MGFQPCTEMARALRPLQLKFKQHVLLRSGYSCHARVVGCGVPLGMQPCSMLLAGMPVLAISLPGLGAAQGPSDVCLCQLRGCCVTGLVPEQQLRQVCQRSGSRSRDQAQPARPPPPAAPWSPGTGWWQWRWRHLLVRLCGSGSTGHQMLQCSPQVDPCSICT